MTDRLELIRAKNGAFVELGTALRACEKRRHTTRHALPETWLERVADLRTAYRRAWLAWERGRSRWTG